MSSLPALPDLSTLRKRVLDDVWLIVVLATGLGMGTAIAYLLTRGLWPFAVALLLALPAFVLLHRYPFAAVILWMLLAPLVVETQSSVFRRVYWLVHRALPPATVALILFSHLLWIRRRKLPRLGLPELAMVAYLAVTLLSVLYLAEDPVTTAYDAYDRIFVPMSLYLIVRLVTPGEEDLKRLLPVASFILLSQTAIGLLSWVAPDVLPGAWLDRVGTRTTGSLGHYAAYSSTVIFSGLFLLYGALSLEGRRATRYWYFLQFLVAAIMVFWSFSRGSWLALLLVILGLLLLYPRQIAKVAVIGVFLVSFLFFSNVIDSYLEYAQARLYSDQSRESALSRLPVIYGSLRMFSERPLFGWGYGNFDEYDFQFQGRVGDLVTPEKDHASHNVYLTILAEQGLAGIITFLAPVLLWLIATVRALPRMSPAGFLGSKFVWVMWLLLLFHVVVNNFSNVQVVFALGAWWMALGFIASAVSRAPILGEGSD